ncbi:uncharacterized protein LOC108278494 [Ictalurus punctatus]|uniref:Uncharacterized protein LOC108278494 n=1 Tax=Ictalurus punctatus TaxID=7998 RepID=A0A2D0SY00_ICTPU|nr:uncharacterized protein LOC108278494 [Ictalurus punctatus]
MDQTLSITGSLCVCISAVMLLQSSPTAAHSNTEVNAPTIIHMAQKFSGTRYRITCRVNPGGLKDEIMVYWLADGDFLETAYKNIRVTKKVKWLDGTEYIETTAVFKKLSQKDFDTNFTCIALSPAGFAKENIQIIKASPRLT